MCSVSWLRGEERLSLVFNRDEQKSRGLALPPSLMSLDGDVQYLSPTDKDSGGTWIMVNAYGLIACLLNYYSAEPVEHSRSRGDIVPQLAACGNVSQGVLSLQVMDLTRYNGFVILLLSPSEEARCLRWDGRLLEERPSVGFLTSSSYRTEEVCAHRQSLYEQADVSSLTDLLELHASHQGPEPAYGVCMHRDDAMTVSQCVIEVDADRIQVRYADGSPCAAELSAGLSIAREAGCPK